jgi:hypothetical protein
MLRDKAITELLELACPSIKYRIKAKILGQSTSHKDLVELQSQILQDPTIKEVINWQQPDGWLEWDKGFKPLVSKA